MCIMTTRNCELVGYLFAASKPHSRRWHRMTRRNTAANRTAQGDDPLPHYGLRAEQVKLVSYFDTVLRCERK